MVVERQVSDRKVTDSRLDSQKDNGLLLLWKKKLNACSFLQIGTKQFPFVVLKPDKRLHAKPNKGILR